ncbi:MAG: response regulator [Planctomycetota bacterium]|jgi:DNA-binding response OmpR family regulator
MSEIPKVLIADDEQTCVDFVRMALSDMHCEVLEAFDGQQALDVAREHHPQLIILDVQMPERSGFDVFMELKKDSELAAVPVIMMTALGERMGMNFDPQEMGEYMGAEPEAYLDKPVDGAALKDTVGRLLEQAQA